MTGPTIAGTSTIALAEDQASSVLQGEVVILNFSSGIYYGLGGVGAQIWHLLQQPRTLNEIRDAIVDEYDVEPERCERDLRELLGRLAAQKLIEIRDGAPA